MAKHIVIQAKSGVGASFPDSAEIGRYHIRGTVIEGPKAIIGKPVEVQMTHAVAQHNVNGIASALLRHPRCGTQPTTQEED